MIVFSARDGIAPTVRRIVVDSRGFIWFVGSEGLARFDGNRFRVFTEADGLPISSTSDILERSDGTYWVAAEEQLCAFDPRPNRQRFQCERPKLGDISALLQDEKSLWCGTDTGLWRRPANGANPWEFVRAIEPDAARRPAVYRLLKDTRGDVWATTVSGLYRLRSNGRVDRWTPGQGLFTDQHSALSETPGAVWAGSATELMRFEIDPNTGEARIADRYGRPDGLPSGYTENVPLVARQCMGGHVSRARAPVAFRAMGGRGAGPEREWAPVGESRHRSPRQPVGEHGRRRRGPDFCLGFLELLGT
jgi:ligand-binding sensor domain-containing protein